MYRKNILNKKLKFVINFLILNKSKSYYYSQHYIIFHISFKWNIFYDIHFSDKKQKYIS